MKYEFMGFDEATLKRFWSKVDRRGPDECWPWLASDNGYGYGAFCLVGKVGKKKIIGAHKFSYMLENGEVRGGCHVCHSCDNPKCVNPNHLWEGTPRDNIHDMHQKGRQKNTPKLGPVNHKAKLQWHQVLLLLAHHKMGVGPYKLAEIFGISSTSVYAILDGRSWGWLTGIFNGKIQQ